MTDNPFFVENPQRWCGMMRPALSNITAPPHRQVAMVPPLDGSAMPGALMAALNRIHADRFSTFSERSAGATVGDRNGQRYDVDDRTRAMAVVIRIAQLQLGARGEALNHLYDTYEEADTQLLKRSGDLADWAADLRRAQSHLPLFAGARATKLAIARTLRRQIGDPAEKGAAARLLHLRQSYLDRYADFAADPLLKTILMSVSDFSRHSRAQIKQTLACLKKTTTQDATMAQDILQLIAPVFAEVGDVLAPAFPLANLPHDPKS